jgi:hypothetical protein
MTRRRTTHRGAIVALVFVTLAIVSGCAAQAGDPTGQPAGDQTLDDNPPAANNSATNDTDFWQPLFMWVEEANPATSLQDLVDRSDIIVAGQVTGLQTGPSTGPEEGPLLDRLLLVARTDTVLKGDPKSQDIYVLIAAPRRVDPATHPRPTGNQALFFLVPAQGPVEAAYYAMTSIAGLVEDTPDGLVAVLDPTTSTLFTVGQDPAHQTFTDLVEQVRTLVG